MRERREEAARQAHEELVRHKAYVVWVLKNAAEAPDLPRDVQLQIIAAVGPPVIVIDDE